jgi:undecaprenyl-diphosphatase
MDQGLNWDVARALSGFAGHNPLVDAIGTAAATDLIFVVVLSAAIWWFWPIANDAGKRALLAAMVAVVGGQALNVLIGHFLFVPRPFVAHQVHLLVKAAQDSSFPSDHATAAFAVATTALLRRMPGRHLLLLGAVVIAFARVYVGAHYPADVIAAAGLGTMWAALILKLDSRLTHPYHLVISTARRLHLG